MSLWKHLNQMGKIKQVFLTYPNLFHGCGFVLVGGVSDLSTVYLASEIPQTERVGFARYFHDNPPYLQWKRISNYGQFFSYVAEYDGIEFKIDNAERIPTIPQTCELVTFDGTEALPEALKTNPEELSAALLSHEHKAN